MGARLVRFVGQDEDFAMFATPSWTGKDESYTIWVNKRSWTVKCDCFGSNRWGLYADLLGEGATPCKHAKSVAELVKRHLGQ